MIKKNPPKKEGKYFGHGKMYFGLSIALFALLWMYMDIKVALLITGLFIFLKGLLMKRCCC